MQAYGAPPPQEPSKFVRKSCTLWPKSTLSHTLFLDGVCPESSNKGPKYGELGSALERVAVRSARGRVPGGPKSSYPGKGSNFDSFTF